MAYRSLLDILTNVGLTSGLQVCLDAGDIASYSGSGQTFADRSGNGFDFYRGATSSSATDDPTFNGTAGSLSSGEYFSGDGGDFISSINQDAWQLGLHKDNAVFTILMLVYIPTFGSFFRLFGNATNSGSSRQGIRGTVNGDRTISLHCDRAGTSATALSVTSTLTVNVDAWNLIAISLTESSSTGGLFHINGQSEQFNPTYSSPVATNPAGKFRFLTCNDPSGPISPSGTRLAEAAAWTVALSAADLLSIFYEAGLRFGLVAGSSAALSGDGSLAATGVAVAAGSAALSATGTLTAAGGLVGAPPPDEEGDLFGPALLSGAPLSSLPVSSIGHLPLPPSDEPTPFDLAVIAAELNLITLVKIELTSSGSV